jgi:hypothetical protein
MHTPLVHVLVINWNGLEHLEACFDSLLQGTYPNVRYVLVDNGSTDGSVEFVRTRYGSDARVEIVQCPVNLGWSGGNNVGMERALAAGAEYVFLLNNDTATEPDALEKLVAMAEAHPGMGALAPKMVLFDYPHILNSVGLECSIIAGSWDKGIGRLDGPRWNRSEPVIGVCGGACLLRSAALRKTGLLPEDFEIYLDDLDLCLRIWNAGYTIWSCPEAVVRHKFSATLGQGARARHKYYLNTRNRMWVILRNFPAGKYVPVKLALIVGECRAIGRALLDGEWGRVSAHARAWCAGMAYWPRAIAERRRRRREGIATCRFWHLIRRDRLFCPGIALPDCGWYAERTVRGLRVRPMSARAWRNVGAGRLRVSLMNCYPALGAAEVQVAMEGNELAQLSTLDTTEAIIDVSGGRIEFEAGRIFEAESTGELMDLGGWLRIEALDD